MNNRSIKERLDRALKQRMYLISARMIKENDWAFVVEGSTGLHYDVLINKKLSCTCKDFLTRSLICKHIYFIIARVLKNSDLINLVGQEPNICIFSLKLNLNENFNKILNPRFNKTAVNDIKIEDIKDVCSICYENYSELDKIVKCVYCKNYFHDDCMKVWLKQAIKCTCPLCRELWSCDEFCKYKN